VLFVDVSFVDVDGDGDGDVAVVARAIARFRRSDASSLRNLPPESRARPTTAVHGHVAVAVAVHVNDHVNGQHVHERRRAEVALPPHGLPGGSGPA
jgi:hypothetical protein